MADPEVLPRSTCGKGYQKKGAQSHKTAVDLVVTKVESLVNGHLRKSFPLLHDPSESRLIIEHRDRFASFALKYLKVALVKKGLRLIVVDRAKVDNELVRDTSKIFTSFSRRVSLGGYVASGWRPRRLAG